MPARAPNGQFVKDSTAPMPPRAANGQFLKSSAGARAAQTLAAKKASPRPAMAAPKPAPQKKPPPRPRKRKARAAAKPAPVLMSAITDAARRLAAGDPALHNKVIEGAVVELARAGELYPTDARGEIDKHDAWMLVGLVHAESGELNGLKWQDGELCNRGCWHPNEHTCLTDLNGVRCD